MSNSEHIHRLKFSTWVVNILIGSFILFIVFASFVFNAEAIIGGNLGISDYLGFVLLVFIMLPFGLLLFTLPFMTKIVVKIHGLEYHTPTYILTTDWKDLVNVGYAKNTHAGKSIVVIPRAGKLRHRNWATPFRKVLIQRSQDAHILVSQFGTAQGHSFETDILVNVAQRADFSNELEPLG